MFFGWIAMHFGWISNACSMDLHLCCLVVGMLSSLRGIKKNIRPRRDCPPIGNGLAVGMLSSRRDVGLSNAFWMGFACFWKDFNAFWIAVQCPLNGFPMHFEWISPFIILWVSPCFFSGSPHSAIGFSFVFQRVPLCFEWFPFTLLLGSPMFSIVLPFVFQRWPPSFFYCPPLCFLVGPYVFYWVPLWFLMGSHHSSLGSPFVSNGFPSFLDWDPLCSLMGSPMFSIGLRFVFEWVPLIILLVSPLFSIGLPFFSYGPPSLLYGFSLLF